MKKLLICLMLAVIVITMTTLGIGCKVTKAEETTISAETTVTESTTAETTAGEKIKIVNYYSSGDSPPERDLYQYFIDEFEKDNPNIDVEYLSEGVDVFRNKIKLLASTKSMYTLTQGYGRDWVEEYVKSGALQDWAPILNADPEWKSIIKPQALDGISNIAGMELPVLPIPGNEMTLGLFVNASLLKEYNLDVPKTWDDLLNVCKVLNDNGIIPWAVGSADVWSSWPFNTFFRRYAGGNDDYDLFRSFLAGTTKFNNPEFLKAAKRIKELVDAKAFPSNAATLNWAQAQELFNTKKAAMIGCGVWMCKPFSDALGDEGQVVFTGLPPFDDAPDNRASVESFTHQGMMLDVNTTGAKLEAVVKWEKFISTKEFAQKYVEDLSIPQPWTFDLDYTKLSNLFKQLNEYIKTNAMPYQVECWTPASFSAVWNAALMDLVSGNATPEQTLDAMDQWYELQNIEK